MFGSTEYENGGSEKTLESQSRSLGRSDLGDSLTAHQSIVLKDQKVYSTQARQIISTKSN